MIPQGFASTPAIRSTLPSLLPTPFLGENFKEKSHLLPHKILLKQISLYRNTWEYKSFAIINKATYAAFDKQRERERRRRRKSADNEATLAVNWRRKNIHHPLLSFSKYEEIHGLKTHVWRYHWFTSLHSREIPICTETTISLKIEKEERLLQRWRGGWKAASLDDDIKNQIKIPSHPPLL